MVIQFDEASPVTLEKQNCQQNKAYETGAIHKYATLFLTAFLNPIPPLSQTSDSLKLRQLRYESVNKQNSPLSNAFTVRPIMYIYDFIYTFV